MAMFQKKMGQLVQLAAERTGSAKGSDAGENFKILEKLANNRKETDEKFLTETKSYLTSLARKNYVEKHPSYMYGKNAIECGFNLHEESEFGSSLIKYGESMKKVAELQSEMESELRESHLKHLIHVVEVEVAEYKQLRKKRENRRLDYDAKASKFEKAKSDKTKLESEEELEAARQKYEETTNKLSSHLEDYIQNEERDLLHMKTAVQHHLKYFKACYELFEALDRTIVDPNVPPETKRESVAPLTHQKTADDFSENLPAPRETGGTEKRPERSKSFLGKTKKLLKSGKSSNKDDPSSSPASASVPFEEENPFGEEEEDEEDSVGPEETSATGRFSPSPASLATASATTTRSQSPYGHSDTSNVYQPSSQAHATNPFQQQQPKPVVKPAVVQKPAVVHKPAVVQKPVVQPPPTAAAASNIYVALYDFGGETPEDLTFRKGDHIEVIRKIDEGWWFWKSNNREGMFPCNYLDHQR